MKSALFFRHCSSMADSSLSSPHQHSNKNEVGENQGCRIKCSCPSQTLKRKQADDKLQTRQRVRPTILGLRVKICLTKCWSERYRVRNRDYYHRPKRIACKVPNRDGKQRDNQKHPVVFFDIYTRRCAKSNDCEAETTERRNPSNPSSCSAACGDLCNKRYRSQQPPHEPGKCVRFDFAPQNSSDIKHIAKESNRDCNGTQNFFLPRNFHYLIITLSNELVGEVWTTYLSPSKSKPKNHLFSGVILVQILWLGVRDSNPRSWDQNPVPYRLANSQ